MNKITSSNPLQSTNLAAYNNNNLLVNNNKDYHRNY